MNTQKFHCVLFSVGFNSITSRKHTHTHIHTRARVRAYDVVTFDVVRTCLTRECLLYGRAQLPGDDDRQQERLDLVAVESQGFDA